PVALEDDVAADRGADEIAVVGDRRRSDVVAGLAQALLAPLLLGDAPRVRARAAAAAAARAAAHRAAGRGGRAGGGAAAGLEDGVAPVGGAGGPGGAVHRPFEPLEDLGVVEEAGERGIRWGIHLRLAVGVAGAVPKRLEESVRVAGGEVRRAVE